MARWRETKKGQNKTVHNKQTTKIYGLCTSPLHRIKAFITDMFLIMMPIMYLTTYVIMDGKDSFQSSEIHNWHHN